MQLASDTLPPCGGSCLPTSDLIYLMAFADAHSLTLRIQDIPIAAAGTGVEVAQLIPDDGKAGLLAIYHGRKVVQLLRPDCPARIFDSMATLLEFISSPEDITLSDIRPSVQSPALRIEAEKSRLRAA